jgi:hypothetical protein
LRGGQQLRALSVDDGPFEGFLCGRCRGRRRAIKAQEIQDKAFCERIVAAGYVGYFVTAYHGRIRDRHVEWFPSAKRQTMMIDVEKRSMPRRSMCL